MNSKSNLMKGLKPLFPLSVAIVLSVVGTVSCNQHSDKTAETTTDSTVNMPPPLVDTAQMRADWDKFKTEANQQIKASEDSVAAFKKKTAKFKGKMKEKYDKEVAMLERKNDTLKVHLNTYKEEGKEKWEDFKVHFKHDMDEVKEWLKDSTIIER